MPTARMLASPVETAVTMTREMDLIRTLMIEIGWKSVRGEFPGSALLVEGRDDAMLLEHLLLLIAAGFLLGRGNPFPGAARSDVVVVTGVTARGRQFIDVTGNALAWANTKHLADRKATAVSVALLAEIANAIGMHSLAA